MFIKHGNTDVSMFLKTNDVVKLGNVKISLIFY